MGPVTHDITHVRDVFKDGRTPRVEKSHCCLCHRKLWSINKQTRGNFCATCNNRADRVAKGIITEEQSDYALWIRQVPLELENWNIDGVMYTKTPNGELFKQYE